MHSKHHVVIIGGGFAGLKAARTLRDAPIRITLIDRRNFHLFQPLLYQVATGDLSAANIAAPIRTILRNQKNVKVLMGDVTGFDTSSKKILLVDSEINYDTLIVAAGSDHHYYGNDHWRENAPGLKYLEDAFEIRNRIVNAFESAENETDSEIQSNWMSFVVIGGGSTGVELAGSLADIATDTLKLEYDQIDPTCWKITLVEGLDRILSQYPEELSKQATASLESRGVKVLTGSMVSDISSDGITLAKGDTNDFIPSKTVIWAAGIKASPLGKTLSDATGAELDKMGRVIVGENLTIPGHQNIFVLGDLARVEDKSGKPLPGLAPVAIQEGQYAAQCIKNNIQGIPTEPFKYHNRGMMSILGRQEAIAMLGGSTYSGVTAWLLWLFVHLMFIVQFGNKLLILLQWAWEYISKDHHARLLTTHHDDEP